MEKGEARRKKSRIKIKRIREIISVCRKQKFRSGESARSEECKVSDRAKRRKSAPQKEARNRKRETREQ